MPRLLHLVVGLGLFPALLAAQAPADSITGDFLAIRIPVSYSLRPMGESTVGIKLRVAATVVIRDFKTIDNIDLGTLRTNAFLAGAELLIPLHRYRTLRPFLDMGVGKDLANGETVFLIEAGMLGEFIFPWRQWHFSVEPAVRLNGTSGNELGSTDDQVQGLLHLEARHAMPVRVSGHDMFGGVYAEAGYFLNSLDFLAASGSTAQVQEGYEVGITLGFYDVRPKIWFLRLPRISVGYRFRGGVDGIRIRIGGDWATPVSAP